MFNFKKTNWKRSLFIILIALVFGILGGLISTFYLWPNILNSNNFLSKEINLNSPEYNSANLVIQDPKKVYISQDLQVEESFNYLNEAVVGVFSKTKNTLDGNYVMTGELMSGLIISSDGWVLLNVLNDKNFDKNILKNTDSYVIISKKDKKVYNIETISDFSDTGLVFAKIKSDNSFTTRNFVNISDLRIGQTLLTYNFSSEIGINSLQKIDSGKNIKFSDDYRNSLILSNPLSKSMANSFLFSLNGDLLGLIDANLNAYPIHDFRSNVFSFLKNKEITNFSWGIYYVDLNNIASSNLPRYGAWVFNNGAEAVVADSLASKLGIKTGDVITKINNYEINNYNNLNDVLNNFIIGDSLSIFVLRDGATLELETDLK
ncbi:MAG TPA: S1C family serine protease [bacterium]|nr:S1C family serine protease [bacterium]